MVVGEFLSMLWRMRASGVSACLDVLCGNRAFHMLQVGKGRGAVRGVAPSFTRLVTLILRELRVWLDI